MAISPGAIPGNDPDPPAITFTIEGPIPAALSRAKPANSVLTRAAPAASVFDGPFGGKRPQS